MKLSRIAMSAAVLTAFAATNVDAFPVVRGAAPDQPSTVQVRNGYGPLPHGIYGSHHRRRPVRSNGTGYHGHGTRTGGPVGGLPNRN